MSSKFLQLNKLEMLLLAKRYDQAIQMALRNKNYAWTVRVAHGLIKAGLLQKTLSLLEKQWAETDDPNVRELLGRLRLMAYVQAGQLDKALELTEEQLKTSPGAFKPRAALISILVEEEKYDKALQLINRWIKNLSHLQPRPDGAEKTLTQLRKSQISFLLQTEKYDQALRKIDQFISDLTSAKPRPTGAMETLAWLRDSAVRISILLGRYDQADKRLRDYLANDPNNAELHNLKATLLTEKGQDTQAVAALERACELKPNNASYQNNLAYCLAEEGITLDKAEKLIKTALRSEGLQSASMDTLAWVYYKKGQFSQAGELFFHLLDGAKEMHDDDLEDNWIPDPVIWDHAGDVFYRLGWTDRALRYWRNALQKAGEEKNATREIRLIRTRTPQKIRDVEAEKPVQLAPLGKNVREDTSIPRKTYNHQ